jgi:hypothetical protein
VIEETDSTSAPDRRTVGVLASRIERWVSVVEAAALRAYPRTTDNVAT